MEWHPNKQLPPEFHQIAQQVYTGDPLWLPESESQLINTFSNPQSYTNNKVWLSLIDKKSRLAGFYIKEKKMAFFGYWETMDTLAPNQILFKEMETWAKKQGAKVIYGPINFSTFNAYRIRLNYFEHGAFHGEPYNPPYYEKLLTALGYQLNSHYYSHFMVANEIMPGLKLMSRRISSQFSFVPLTADLWMQNLTQFYTVIDTIFADNFAYSAISYEIFSKNYGLALAQRLCPKTSVLALDKNQNIAGFSLIFPDYAPLCQQGLSKPLNFADINYSQYYSKLPKPRVGLGKTMAVLPAYRNKGLSGGLYTLLSIEVAKNIALYYEEAGFCLIREGNSSQALAKRYQRRTHLYGLYQKDL